MAGLAGGSFTVDGRGAKGRWEAGCVVGALCSTNWAGRRMDEEEEEGKVGWTTLVGGSTGWTTSGSTSFCSLRK